MKYTQNMKFKVFDLLIKDLTMILFDEELYIFKGIKKCFHKCNDYDCEDCEKCLGEMELENIKTKEIIKECMFRPDNTCLIDDIILTEFIEEGEMLL